jgi:hypothetical protein
MKLYLAGRMTGLPMYGFPLFDAARDDLLAQGYEVVSPADLDRAVGFDGSAPNLDGFDKLAAIRRDIEAIIDCDAIYMLRGWENSTGAQAEYHLAKWLGKEVMFQ